VYIWINISELFLLILHRKLHYYNNAFFKYNLFICGKNDFAEESKILPDTENNFVGSSK